MFAHTDMYMCVSVCVHAYLSAEGMDSHRQVPHIGSLAVGVLLFKFLGHFEHGLFVTVSPKEGT